MIDVIRRDDWDEALSKFWVHEVPESTYGLATVDKYRQSVTWLRRAASRPQGLDRASIVRLQKEAIADGIQPETINSVMGPAKKICDWFVSRGLIEKNPIDRKLMRLRPKNARIREDKFLSESDLNKLLARSDFEFDQAGDLIERWKAARMRALVYLLCLTGMRKMEALRLPRHRYNGQSILIVGEDHPEFKTKTFSSERRVPVPHAAKVRLDEWLSMIDFVGPRSFLFPGIQVDRPWVSGCAGTRALERVQQLAERAQLSSAVTIHNLRHTFATHAVMRWGLTAEQVGMIMGHSTIHTQRVYIHYDKRMMTELMDRVTVGVSNANGVVPPASLPARTSGELPQGGCSDASSIEESQRNPGHRTCWGDSPRHGDECSWG